MKKIAPYPRQAAALLDAGMEMPEGTDVVPVIRVPREAAETHLKGAWEWVLDRDEQLIRAQSWTPGEEEAAPRQDHFLYLDKLGLEAIAESPLTSDEANMLRSLRDSRIGNSASVPGTKQLASSSLARILGSRWEKRLQSSGVSWEDAPATMDGDPVIRCPLSALNNIRKMPASGARRE